MPISEEEFDSREMYSFGVDDYSDLVDEEEKYVEDMEWVALPVATLLFALDKCYYK